MNVVELPADEAAVRRFVEELWLPYNRDLEATVERFALADVDGSFAGFVAAEIDEAPSVFDRPDRLRGVQPRSPRRRRPGARVLRETRGRADAVPRGGERRGLTATGRSSAPHAGYDVLSPDWTGRN